MANFLIFKNTWRRRCCKSLLQVIVSEYQWDVYTNVTIGEHDRLNLPTVCLFPGPLPILSRSHISVQMLNKEKLGGCLARAGARASSVISVYWWARRSAWELTPVYILSQMIGLNLEPDHHQHISKSVLKICFSTFSTFCHNIKFYCCFGHILWRKPDLRKIKL